MNPFAQTVLVLFSEWEDGKRIFHMMSNALEDMHCNHCVIDPITLGVPNMSIDILDGSTIIFKQTGDKQGYKANQIFVADSAKISFWELDTIYLPCLNKPCYEYALMLETRDLPTMKNSMMFPKPWGVKK